MTSGKGAAITTAALALLFSFVWSSAFIAGKIALKSFDPATTLALQFALSAALLAPFGLSATAAPRRSAPIGLALGLLNNAAYLGLTFSALTFTRPVVVIVVVSLAPFVTMGLAAALGLERTTLGRWFGAAVAFCGVLVITGPRATADDLTGVALAAAGTLCFSIGSVAYRARGGGLGIQPLNFWQSLAGALALGPIAMFGGRGLAATSLPAVAAVLYLAIGVTIGGMALWMALIRRAGAGAASAYHLLNPAFGALLAFAVLGAPLRAADFVGATIIALGLWLANAASRRGGAARA